MAADEKQVMKVEKKVEAEQTKVALDPEVGLSLGHELK